MIVEQTSKEVQKRIQIHNVFASTKFDISQHERPEENGSPNDEIICLWRGPQPFSQTLQSKSGKIDFLSQKTKMDTDVDVQSQLEKRTGKV